MSALDSLLALALALPHVPATPVAGAPGHATSAPADWERIQPDLQLRFPRDHGAHPRTQTEWWYITGQLATPQGRRFGYQFTVFRRGLDPAPPAPEDSPLRARQVLIGHLALTDVASGRTLFADRLRRLGSGLTRCSEEDLDLVLEDWTLARGAGDRLELVAGDAAQGIAFELSLEPRKPLVFQGEGGYSSKGRDVGNASAYTSWTRLATRGTLDVDGERSEVEGESWFDHEFGSSVLEEGVSGWDWFGLQLDGNRELMLFHLRREGGPVGSTGAATLVEADGSSRYLTPDDFEIIRGGAWTSSTSGATYPTRWRVLVPSAGIDIEVTPLVADCEVGGSHSAGVVYWEGPVDVTGSAVGRGYVELTGYAGSMEGRF